jgi:hypothetical protein
MKNWNRGFILVLGIGVLSVLTYLVISLMGGAARKQDVVGNTFQTELFHVLGPACKVLIINQDINGDRKPEAVGALLHESRRILPTNVYWVDRMVAIRLERRKRVVLLDATPLQVVSTAGTPLVPQIQAKHGYLARYSTDAKGNLAFHLAIADSLGQDASETLTFNWNATTKQYETAVMGMPPASEAEVQ